MTEAVENLLFWEYQLLARLAHEAMGEVWEAECVEAHAGLRPATREALKIR